jgi:hypothetical protein
MDPMRDNVALAMPDRETRSHFTLPGLLAFVTATCYVVGLLIVNLDLARFGIWDVELGKAQYVLVGALWLVLTGLGAAWFVLSLLALGWVFKDRTLILRSWHEAPRTVLRFILSLCSLALLEVILFFLLLWAPLWLFSGIARPTSALLFSDALGVIGIGFGGLFLFVGARQHVPLNWPWVVTPATSSTSKQTKTVDRSELMLYLPLGMFLVIIGLAMYTYSTYPSLSKTLGGGRPALVRLILDHRFYGVWPRDVWVSTDGRRAGPVALLRETQDSITIGPANDKMTWYSHPGEPAPAVQINRTLISMVLNEWQPRLDDVIVLGGIGKDGKATAEANVFRPQDGWFSGEESCNLGKTMTNARIGPAATLIPENDAFFILITGGLNQAAHALRVAEAFEDYSAVRDRSRGFTQPQVALHVARAEHSSTLLPDNHVLIAGGRNDDGPVGSAELFQLRGEKYLYEFENTGSLRVARSRHTATALGFSRSAAGKVLIVGGIGATGRPLRDAEIYAQDAGAFHSTASMTDARQGHAATLLQNGSVLITGGSDGGNVLATAELFDPGHETFRKTGDMHEARESHTAVLLDDGSVLISGGRGSQGVIGTTELYNAELGTFIEIAGLLIPRAEHTATLLNDGSVLFAGGIGRDGKPVNLAEIFDPWTQSFRTAGKMPIPMTKARAVLLQLGGGSD